MPDLPLMTAEDIVREAIDLWKLRYDPVVDGPSMPEAIVAALTEAGYLAPAQIDGPEGEHEPDNERGVWCCQEHVRAFHGGEHNDGHDAPVSDTGTMGHDHDRT